MFWRKYAVMKILCKTLFDCTSTGTTGTFRPSVIPTQDRSGRQLQSQQDWNYSRNQQRNWETLLQIIQLRSQVEILDPAVRQHDHWSFVFAVELDNVYGEGLSALYQDAQGVPMLVGLGEQSQPTKALMCSGPQQNIWFETINISS